MSQLKKRILLLVLLLLPVSLYMGAVLISGELTYDSLETMGPAPGFEGSSVEDFHMEVSDGTDWTPERMEGKISVVSFFFTSCPTVCPAMNSHIAELHNRMGAYKDIQFVSYTVDPSNDDAETLETYKSHFAEGSEAWHFIRGERNFTYDMANAYYLAASQDSSAEGGYNHSQTVVLVDWNGDMRTRLDEHDQPIGAYDVTQATVVKDLIEDLRILVKEYRGEKMGQGDE